MGRPTLVSLFAGAGGLDLGLEQAGFETIFANEVEPYACETLRANRALQSLAPSDLEKWLRDHVWSQRCYKAASRAELANLRRRVALPAESAHRYLGCAQIDCQDVRRLTAESILEATRKRRGEIALVAGGPPCQPFSRAGKRELVDCDTGQLFQDFVRLVADLKPRWFLFENVKGLVLHKADVAKLRCVECGTESIADFDRRAELKEASEARGDCPACGHVGRSLVVWEKKRAGSLDIIENEFSRNGYACTSKVLNAADFGAPQTRQRLFIIGSRDNEPFDWPEPTHREPAAKAGLASLFDLLPQTTPPWRTVNDALYAAGHWRYGPLDPERGVLWVKNVVRPHDEPVTWTLDRPAPTIGAHQSAKLAIAPFGVPEEQLKRQQWHVLGKRQGDTRPVKVEHEYLTDEELLALQTFPRSWYLHGTRMQRAFQIGNAVPPCLARSVGRSIAAAMGPPIDERTAAEASGEDCYVTSI